MVDTCEKCTKRIDQCVCRYKRGHVSTKTSKPPKNIPTVLQLPGGVTVKGFAFRITRLDAQGRAVEFELATGNEDSDCVLWASPQFLAQPLPDNLKKRVRERIEESIEGKAYVTDSRDLDTVGLHSMVENNREDS